MVCQLHIKISPQFKTNTLFLSYRFSLEKERRSEIAMLARMFQYGTSEYPSKRELKQQLEMLYNVQFATGVERDGTEIILTFSLIFPEYRFVGDEEAFSKALMLFQNVIETPYFMAAEDFSEALAQEKVLLKSQIESEYDNKTSYAFTKLQTLLLQDTPYFEDITGTVEMVEAVSIEQIRHLWQEITRVSTCEVYGVVALQKTADLLQETFIAQYGSHSSEYTEKELEPLRITPFKEVEIQNVTQAKINFAFTSGITIESPEYFASIVATSLFGGGSQSKLFQNVREKHSLAYYANAISDGRSGILYVYSGVNIEKIEAASQCIFEQIQLMRDGEITEDEIVLTQKVLVNGLRESLNRPMGLIQFERKLQKHADIHSLEEYVTALESVTKEDVMKVAQQWTYCGEFILKGGE